MVKSPIKIIDSGTAPTTANLGEGQIAFGTVDGATKLYGSDGTTITDLTTSGGRGPQGPAGQDGITPTIGDNGNWFLGETDTGKPSRGEQGPKGEQGDPGPKGEQGDPGAQGEPGQAGAPGTPGRDGADGAAAGFGTVSATVDSNTGTPSVEVATSGDNTAKNFTFTFHNLKGEKGEKGDTGAQGNPGPQGEPGQAGAPGTAGAPGAAATITVGTTTTGEAGTEASVTNSGTTSAAVLNFTIPKGAKGDKGDKGDTGPAGTTTFAGLTDQPTDNAALKTALDAKVSSVTAGEGISITGTATEPVISAAGGATYALLPDYDNWREITDEVDDNGGWVATDDGFLVSNVTYNDDDHTQKNFAVYTYESGSSGVLFPLYRTAIPATSADVPANTHVAWIIVTRGKKFSLSSKINKKNYHAYFIPFKQSTVTPNEFTDTGWMEITASSGSGLKYLTGPWAIPSGSSLRIRKFGTHVTVSGVLQCTEDIAKGDQQFLLSIPSSDSHFNELHLPDNGSVEIPRKCGGMIYITEATPTRPSFQAQAMVSLSDNGKAIAAYITVVDFLYGYAQESIPNGSAIGVTFGWDTEA